MDQKSMCAHLDFVAQEFLGLFDEPMRYKLASKMYFAGGCIYCLRNDKQVKDYDIFLRDQSIFDEISNLDIWMCKTKYALSRGKYQLVVKYYGDPLECVGEFDFRHNMYYYVPFSGEIKSANPEDQAKDFEMYQYITTNELIFNSARARDIEGVWLRIAKFEKRGMKATKETKREIKAKTTRKAVKKYQKEFRKRRSRNRSYY